MSIEEFKSLDSKTLSISKLISIIDKNQILYINHQLVEFGINVSQLHFLFEISHHNEINQEKIASRCNLNKGAVARSIKKLEDMNLVKREIDANNRRQNKVSLTPKGEKTLNLAHEKLDAWEDYVLNDINIEKELLQEILKDMTIKSIKLNHKEELNE